MRLWVYGIRQGKLEMLQEALETLPDWDQMAMYLDNIPLRTSTTGIVQLFLDHKRKYEQVKELGVILPCRRWRKFSRR
jgi:hypothetical protein